MSGRSLPPISEIPSRAGVGFKPEHFGVIHETIPDVGFFEVHAENYMIAGGPPHRYLSAIRERYPLSLHGVGLSIGSNRPLDRDHLSRLKNLIVRYEPALFSEHLAWSTHDSGFLNDLLPLPYTAETLSVVVDHVQQVQDTLGRQMLLENPSTYLTFAESTFSETDFITEIAKRSGCGLLLDINNVYVASINQEWNPFDYIDSFPLDMVREIHLAGHANELDEQDRPLLIDTHDRPVDQLVWSLFEYVISNAGPIPTLIEWDAHLPDWTVLKSEADRAEAIMRDVAKTRRARLEATIRMPALRDHRHGKDRAFVR